MTCTDASCRGGLTCQCENNAVIFSSFSSLELSIGLTNSRDSLICNNSILSDDLAYLGYELYKKPQLFLADALSVSLLLLTQDHKIPLFQEIPQGYQVRRYSRDNNEADHAEPFRDRINTLPPPKSSQSDAPWDLFTVDPDPLAAGVNNAKDLTVNNERVVKEELIACVVKSLSSIFALKESNCSKLALFAVVYDPGLHSKPTLVFTSALKTSSFQLFEAFQESKSKKLYDIAFVDVPDIKIQSDLVPLHRYSTLSSKEFVVHKTNHQSFSFSVQKILSIAQDTNPIDLTKLKK